MAFMGWLVPVDGLGDGIWGVPRRTSPGILLLKDCLLNLRAVREDIPQSSWRALLPLSSVVPQDSLT